MDERPLPSSMKAEAGVLGSLLIDPEAITEVSDLLLPEDFADPAHQVIYQAALTLSARRVPVDLVTLGDELERRSQLEEIGGSSYLASLVGGVPTSLSARYYARIVAKKAEFRRLIKAAARIAAEAYEEVEEALPRAEAAIMALSRDRRSDEFISLGQYFPEYLSHLDALEREGGSRGIPTGFTDLDALALLQRGDLVVPAARPRVGKTTLCLNIAYNAALSYGKRVGFFSCEMTKEALMDSFVSRDLGLDSLALLTASLTDEDHTRLIRENRLEALGIYLKHSPGIYLDDLAHQARRLVSQRGIDLLIVDYLQLVRARIDGRRVTPREMEVAEVARGLKMLAGELQVPILAPAQINREVESIAVVRDGSFTYRLPKLSHLRESGEIEQSADAVLFLARSEEQKERVKLVIEKNRRGPEGELDLYFQGNIKRFKSIEEVLHASS